MLCIKVSSGGQRNCATVQASPLPQNKYKICSEDGWSISTIHEKREGTPPLSASHNPPLSCEITERKLVITCGHCCVVRNESWTAAVEFSDPDTEFICHWVNNKRWFLRTMTCFDRVFLINRMHNINTSSESKSKRQKLHSYHFSFGCEYLPVALLYQVHGVTRWIPRGFDDTGGISNHDVFVFVQWVARWTRVSWKRRINNNKSEWTETQSKLLTFAIYC